MGKGDTLDEGLIWFKCWSSSILDSFSLSRLIQTFRYLVDFMFSIRRKYLQVHRRIYFCGHDYRYSVIDNIISDQLWLNESYLKYRTYCKTEYLTAGAETQSHKKSSKSDDCEQTSTRQKLVFRMIATVTADYRLGNGHTRYLWSARSYDSLFYGGYVVQSHKVVKLGPVILPY